MSNNKKKELNIRVPESLAPTFANMIAITHSDDEFSLRFVHRVHGTNRAEAKAIVSITPKHAKRLLKALKNNIQKYEKQFGKIDLPEEPEREKKLSYVG